MTVLAFVKRVMAQPLCTATCIAMITSSPAERVVPPIPPSLSFFSFLAELPTLIRRPAFFLTGDQVIWNNLTGRLKRPQIGI